MKGVGTFRRLMSAVVGVGLASNPASKPTAVPLPPTQDDAAREKRRKPRSGKSWVRRTHNLKRQGWPLVYWTGAVKPLSRKQLKKIASEHYLLKRTR